LRLLFPFSSTSVAVISVIFILRVPFSEVYSLSLSSVLEEGSFLILSSPSFVSGSFGSE
jgi:hypothetical protein